MSGLSFTGLNAQESSRGSRSSRGSIEAPRVKKISLEEAEQYRKDVLDPEFPEEQPLKEGEELPLIHDDPILAQTRKISRLNTCNPNVVNGNSGSVHSSLSM